MSKVSEEFMRDNMAAALMGLCAGEFVEEYNRWFGTELTVHDVEWLDPAVAEELERQKGA